MKKLFGRKEEIWEEEVYDGQEEDYGSEEAEFDGAGYEEADYEAEEEYAESDEVWYAEETDGDGYGDEEAEDPDDAEEDTFAEVLYGEAGSYEEDDAYGISYGEDGEFSDGEVSYTEDGELLEDGIYYAEAEDVPDDGYYEQEPDAGDDYDTGYYGEEVFLEEEEDAPAGKGRLAALWGKFRDMEPMDKLLACTGVLILIVALTAGSIYAGIRMTGTKLNEFVSVGSSLDEIELPGQLGLLAVADAEAARKAAAEALEEEQNRQEEEEQPEYNETDYRNAVTVEIHLSSIEKDLKIKFVNKDSGKLISNVPFAVTVTDASGKASDWTDDDMDGIIYQTKLTPGKYSVQAKPLENEKYRNFTIPTIADKVDVKKEIEYKKVDVTGEMKNESEVNVNEEEAPMHGGETGERPADTVEWVDSTQTPAGPRKVDKSTIPDPKNLAYAGSFRRLAESTAAPEESHTVAIVPAGETTLNVGGTLKLSATLDGAASSEGEWKAEGSAVKVEKNEDGTATVTALAAGAAKITYTVSVPVSGGDAKPYSAECQVTVNAMTLSLNPTALTVYTGKSATITATLGNAGGGTELLAESSSGAATVSVSGTTVTVNGVEAGSATVTVKVKGNEALQAACAVTVKTDPAADKSHKLTDQNGKQVYVLEGGQYREAVWADYYTAGEFYIMGDIKYTGWQTLNDKVYYFDKDGNKVTGEQVIGGVRYAFASDGSLTTGTGNRGIDVSKHNGSIDWTAVKNAGIDFVIIRCGYRGTATGVMVKDPKFETNIKGATNAGLKVGVYFFSQAVSSVEAVEEASMALELIKNYKITYPVFLDVEAGGGRADNISKETRTDVCKAFCQTVQNAGYTAGIYANKDWFTNKINASSLSAYKIWLAQYASRVTYTGRYDMWQHQSTGRVNGITGDVDMNWSYLGY